MDINEDFIKVTKYDVLGELPNPFVFNNGDKVLNISDWKKRKKEIYDLAVTFQYGNIPPEPEILEIEYTYALLNRVSVRIITGTKEKPISFKMELFLPAKEGKFPVIIDGDMCFKYPFESDFVNTIINNDIALALFNRTDLAPDVYEDPDKNKGQVLETYRDLHIKPISAWAWGYSRCVDALLKMDVIDENCIVFTGHSRGGKTAMLAGALDERAAVVNPNDTCAGACSCYRVHMEAITENGTTMRSETLADMNEVFPHWLGEEMHKYSDRENELPFDSHFLKAMVAPRILFVSEAASDIWANPIGSWQTTMGAKEVYKLYNKEDNLFWYFRPGYHYHKIEDIEMLINIIKNKTQKTPLSDKFFVTPFKKPELIFNWRCPQREEQ